VGGQPAAQGMVESMSVFIGQLPVGSLNENPPISD
jgi:hypothetical protein